MFACLQDIICRSFESLGVGTRSKVSSPVTVRLRGVREEVVGLDSKLDIFGSSFVIDGLNVARGSRIDQIDLVVALEAAKSSVSTLSKSIDFVFILPDKFVHVDEIFLGGLVLEVSSHRNEEIVRLVITGQLLHF